MQGLRNRRKGKVGVVISDKMRKTIIVKVQRLMRHPAYKKIVRRYTKFKVHDEEGKAKVGQIVRIMETRPISKDKRWRLVEIIK